VGKIRESVQQLVHGLCGIVRNRQPRDDTLDVGSLLVSELLQIEQDFGDQLDLFMIASFWSDR
jgi:hypothetical protein